MLTAAQVEVVAYSTPWGEFFCPECTVGRLEQDGGPGVEGFEPVIAYSLDEYQGEISSEMYREGDAPEGCTDECAPYQVVCESCGTELVEPYHYGHQEDEDEPTGDEVIETAIMASRLLEGDEYSEDEDESLPVDQDEYETAIDKEEAEDEDEAS